MLSGADFIVFSDDWGRHPFSCKHIMRHFLPENRVLWVQTVGMRRPRLTWYDLRRSAQKLRSFLAPEAPEQESTLPENLAILNPAMLPFGNGAVRALNRRSVQRAVRAKLDELGMRDPILITTLPNASDYLDSCALQASVYYCVDDFTLWPGANVRLVREMEQALLDQVDLLVCSSEELADIKRRPGLATAVLPHGVDYDHFARAGRGDNHDARQGGKGPVIGYFGLLGEWVDLELLEAIALQFPDATLMLVGTVVADISRLAGYGNVVCPGPVPYEQLPDQVSAMDLLILPYHTCGRGQTITPLKLREYLATGKPIVASDIPECRRFDSVMSVAISREQFLEQIRQGLAEGMSRAEERRRAVARESWRDRAEQLALLLAEAVQKRSTS